MGRKRTPRVVDPSYSSFPSPSSSSSSDFEFTVSLSPSSRKSAAHLCPADELFYKGQLLPLHLTPRISMVRTLILASSSTSSSSDTTTTASRDSNGSSNGSTSSFSGDLLLIAAAAAAAAECDSSRPSSVTEEDAKRVPNSKRSSAKYFSSLATKFSSVFHRKKDQNHPQIQFSASSGRRTPNSSSSSAKEVIKKYVKKVKPIYEKLSSMQQKQQQQGQAPQKKPFSFSIRKDRGAANHITMCFAPESSSSPKRGSEIEEEVVKQHGQNQRGVYAHSFSGNLMYRRRTNCAAAASCPSSMRSSPSHSGLLRAGGSSGSFPERVAPLTPSSSMEELQSAIQGAIAHCKSTMAQSNHKKFSLAGHN